MDCGEVREMSGREIVEDFGAGSGVGIAGLRDCGIAGWVWWEIDGRI